MHPHIGIYRAYWVQTGTADGTYGYMVSVYYGERNQITMVNETSILANSARPPLNCPPPNRRALVPHAQHMSQIAPNGVSRDLAPLERSLSEAR